MTDADLIDVLARFDVVPRRIAKPPDAKLADVYIVDDRHVLRSRELGTDTRQRLAVERELLEEVAGLTGYAFPRYRPCLEGGFAVADGTRLWTVHALIPGRPLGTWFELHRVPPQVDRQVLAALQRLHTATRGRFDAARVARSYFFDLLAPAVAAAPGFASPSALRRIDAALARAAAHAAALPASAAGFVHGDFHHGNILARDGRITGFIDLDWCRVGSRFEDLGYTLMMWLRDYRRWSPAFREDRYRSFVSLCPCDDDRERALLDDYTVLYALFDCGLFQAATFPGHADFFGYQASFLKTLCRRL